MEKELLLSKKFTPPGLGGMPESEPEPTIREEDIQATIDNWDVQAVDDKLFVVKVEQKKEWSDGTCGAPVRIPDIAQKSQCDAVVISAGPLAYVCSETARHPGGEPYTEEERRWLSPQDLDCATKRFLQPGDRVNVGRFQGAEMVSRKGKVRKGADKLMIIRVTDIQGVIR